MKFPDRPASLEAHIHDDKIIHIICRPTVLIQREVLEYWFPYFTYVYSLTANRLDLPAPDPAVPGYIIHAPCKRVTDNEFQCLYERASAGFKIVLVTDHPRRLSPDDPRPLEPTFNMDRRYGKHVYCVILNQDDMETEDDPEEEESPEQAEDDQP